jgi:2-isopropylmalate synthase
MAQRLVIFDTTLRDGEQAPGFSMRVDEKIRLARQLESLGVDVIEAGFPIASDADAEAVRRIAQMLSRATVAALARCAAGDIDRAAWSLAPARRSRIQAAVSSVARARTYTDDVEFSAEDATRSDRDFLCRVVEGVIAAGATTINLPDTVGYSTPDEIAEFFIDIMSRVPNADRAIFSAHCHDDLGLAVANSLAAIGAGVRQVECTINGIGERAGNASLEEIVMATHVRHDRLPVDCGVVTTQLYAASQMLSEITGERVQANKAIVGRNAFAHEAGIHQDGMLKDRRTYEIMRPEDVGVPQTTLVLGKHSGRHAVQKRCEQLGLALSRHDLDQIYRRMVTLADIQKHVSDDDLQAIAVEVCGAAAIPGARDGQEAGYGFGV